MDPQSHPSPVSGNILPLSEDLFREDAVIFDRIDSSGLTYAAPGTPAVRLKWHGFSQLGLWSKDSANFICIEPWQGHASPVGFDGEFSEKPGLFFLRPAETRLFSLTVTIEDV